MKIKINKPIGGYNPPSVIDIPADANGVPLDKAWRRRLQDARIDNCVEVVKPSKLKKG